MKTVAITGANGFVGKNLVAHLEYKDGVEVIPVTREDSKVSLVEKISRADFIFHLAGVNRPTDPKEFQEVNADFTRLLCDVVAKSEVPTPIVYSSSTQAVLDNPYGASKKEGEEHLEALARQGVPVKIYRFPGLFGKWCKPNYNSVVATFCHNTTHDIPIEVHSESTQIRLVYVDDVVKHFVEDMSSGFQGCGWGQVEPEYEIGLGDLAARVRSFRARETLLLPDFGNPLTKKLYSTYLSYLKKDDFAYFLQERHDDRGKLFEVLKSESAGQIFLSTTKPGITRGNHFHHSKVEKFCVVSGDAIIRFRHIRESEVLEYPVSGDKVQVVDIPPGYTHNIENVGQSDMIVLFWVNEPFDPSAPDTEYVGVLKDE